MSRLSELATIGMTAIVCLASLAALPPIYRKVAVSDGFEAIRKADPALGSRCSLPSLDSVGKRLRTGRRTVVVLLGSCTSCSMSGFEVKNLHVPSDDSVVLIVSDKVRNLPKSLTSRSEYGVIADPERRYERMLNAYWMPRLVLLDSANWIVWMQPRPNEYPEGVTYGP